MCTRPGERDRSIKHDRGINAVPRNWNRHAHTDGQLGETDQSEAQSTHVQNLNLISLPGTLGEQVDVHRP